MNKMNTTGRLLALLLAALMVLSLAACGTKSGDKKDGMGSDPKNAEEAAAMHKAVNLKFVNAHTTENNLISPAPKMPERYKKYKMTTGKTISGRNQMMLATLPPTKRNRNAQPSPVRISRLLIL